MTRICSTADCGRELYARNHSGLCKPCSLRMVASKAPRHWDWTAAEIERLRRLWPVQGRGCVEQFPGRSLASIQSKATALGIKIDRDRKRANVPAKPVNARDGYDRKQQQRYGTHRRRNLAKARALVDQGVTVGDVRQGHMKQAILVATEQAAEERRRADPIEQAKLRLQRRGPVYSMAIIGGKPGFYFVHGRRDVPEQDLLAMARAS